MLKMYLFLALLAVVPSCISGHGMVLSPVNRASRWRFDKTAPINYDDNGLFCGGMIVQWHQNGGKCGLCGDNYADPTPRTYELGGAFGQGVIVQRYPSGSVMPVQVLVTANHLGSFSFALCNLDTFREESEECFEAIPLTFLDGREKVEIGKAVGRLNFELQIPEDVVCEHCVLQWTWTAGNSWGICEDGQQGMGCGAQESFRTCSDITIYKNDD